MSDTLLPCPFCGGEAHVVRHEKKKWLAFCEDVYGCGTEGWYEDTPEKAIAAWNRRSPTIPPDVHETLRETIQRERDSLARHTNERKQYYAIYKRWPDGDDSLVTRWTDKLSRYDAALAWLDAQGGGRNG